MSLRSKVRWEWFAIGVLSIVIIIVGFLYLEKDKALKTKIEKKVAETPEIHTEKDRILRKYEKLELAYNNTINEIESVVKDENINLAILKENLQQILETIKAEKDKINNSDIDSIKFSSQKKARQLNELLEMSKEVLAERLIEMQEKNSKLTIDNRKLYYNLKKSIHNFEREKARNIQLNEKVGKIKEKIHTLETEGIRSKQELKSLKREKGKLEKQLTESNEIIHVQDKQIRELGEIIRKVNIDCYYIYEKGNPVEEAKIYLTSQGISEKYIQYFIRKKPDIYVQFKIPKDLYETDVEKVELKFYNSLNVEIYNVVKPVNSENMKIIIPNKNYPPGKYSIAIYAGDESLLINDRFWIKISK
ncbi:MAG: hypothetical protein L3J74_18120 [Bacteroidales bacterium]|nr:hypothetical protein [Bacteroidales bacterium]